MKNNSDEISMDVIKTIEKIKNENLPIIIFGAGGVGEALFYFCREAGIKIECFCDNSVNKIGKLVRDKKIIHTLNLRNEYPEAIFIISASDIKDVVEQLESLDYSKWYPCAPFLRNFDVYKHKYSVPEDFVDYTVATALLCQDSYFEPDKIFLRSVDIIITECCSLKCRDCSNLMEYYKNPQNCKTEDLLKDIDRFCELVDEVFEFRILGGEPFMNREFNVIVDRLVKEPKVKKIVFYTNGTIIPNDEQLKSLANKKVLILITNYGKLSRNIEGLICVLKQNNIAFYVRKAQSWTDCSKINKHNRSVEENKKVFRNCCTKNTTTLSSGKVYRCPFSANIGRLRAVRVSENDFIDIFPKEPKDIKSIRKEIKQFISTDYLKICDYCNGRSFTAPEIEPAVQLTKPLKYQRKEGN